MLLIPLGKFLSQAAFSLVIAQFVAVFGMRAADHHDVLDAVLATPVLVYMSPDDFVEHAECPGAYACVFGVEDEKAPGSLILAMELDLATTLASTPWLDTLGPTEPQESLDLVLAHEATHLILFLAGKDPNHCDSDGVWGPLSRPADKEADGCDEPSQPESVELH